MAENKGAWHGDPELKARIVERMKQHRKDDALVQNVYQVTDQRKALGYRGCAIGCMLDRQSSDHFADAWYDEVETQFGIDAAVAGLIDACFESFSPAAVELGEHAAFAIESLAAIEPGSDLAHVWWPYVNSLYRRPELDDDPQLLLQLLRDAPQVTR